MKHIIYKTIIRQKEWTPAKGLPDDYLVWDSNQQYNFVPRFPVDPEKYRREIKAIADMFVKLDSSLDASEHRWEERLSCIFHQFQIARDEWKRLNPQSQPGKAKALLNDLSGLEKLGIKSDGCDAFLAEEKLNIRTTGKRKKRMTKIQR